MPVHDQLRRAVENRNLVRLRYRDDTADRFAQPACLGVRSGNATVRAHQTTGASVGGEVPGWKSFILEDIRELEVLDETFSGPIDRYSLNDKDFEEIHCQLPVEFMVTPVTVPAS